MEGRTLSLSNLDKVMYPEVGFTKGQVIDYYTRVAPVLLPHLRGHPLTMKRYPNGVEGQFFYEKQCPSHRPDWVSTAPIPTGRKTIDFCLCEDLPTLVWMANLADLELHPSLSLATAIERPAVMAFDLDPGAPAGIAECCEVAVLLRETLGEPRPRVLPEDLGLEGAPGLRAAQPRRGDLRRHQAARAGARAPSGGAAPQADRVDPEEGAPQGQGADRLEPERRAQDDRVGLLAAGRAHGPPSRRRCAGRSSTIRRRSASRPTRCSRGSSATAICSSPCTRSSRSSRSCSVPHDGRLVARPPGRGSIRRRRRPRGVRRGPRRDLRRAGGPGGRVHRSRAGRSPCPRPSS